eukprot:m.99158 g.99158  ORF g.99158 m.99158 type:complete len:467 (+) comp37043_c0_seq2:167-1567(+)
MSSKKSGSKEAVVSPKARIVIVGDNEEDRGSIRTELGKFVPDNVVFLSASRQDLRDLVSKGPQAEFRDFFVVAVPKATPLVIYKKDDKTNSFCEEINMITKYCGSDVNKQPESESSGEIQKALKILILIYNWKDDVEETQIHHPELKEMWEREGEQELKFFRDHIFTLRGFALSSRQEKVLKAMLGDLDENIWNWVTKQQSSDLQKLCANQTILLLGLPGAGKSSLINSFSTIFYGEYPENQDEVDVGTDRDETTTHKLEKRIFTNEQGRAVNFLDTCGYPIEEELGVSILGNLLLGKLKDGTNLKDELDKEKRILDDQEENPQADGGVKENPELDTDPGMLPSIVVIVLNAETDIECVPSELLRKVGDSIKTMRKEKEDGKGRQPDLLQRPLVFLVATKEDKVKLEEKDAVASDLNTFKKYCEFNCSFLLSNYIRHGNDRDRGGYSTKVKHGILLNAFSKILSHT